MPYDELDTIVLTRDILDLALHAGKLGLVVLRHSAEMVEVEFSATAQGLPESQ